MATISSPSNQYRPPQQQPHSIPAETSPPSRVIYAPVRRELVPGALPQRPMPRSPLRNSSSAEDLLVEQAEAAAARRALYASPLLRSDDNGQLNELR